MATRDAARTASAKAMRPRREARSARMPAGMAKRRKGKVCAVCSRPVSPAPAPKAKTATIGAAASQICAADCAARFDQTRRLKPAGSEVADEVSPAGPRLASMQLSMQFSWVLDDMAGIRSAGVGAARLAFGLVSAYLCDDGEARPPLVARQFKFGRQMRAERGGAEFQNCRARGGVRRLAGASRSGSSSNAHEIGNPEASHARLVDPAFHRLRSRGPLRR